MKTITSESGVKKVYGNIEARKILTTELKKGVQKVQLFQTVETIYPSTQVQTGLFSASDFNIADGQSYKSVRTSLLDVPAGTTVEQVQDKVDVLSEATLYKYISNDVMDVLSQNQKNALDAGLQTIASYQASFLIRTADGEQPVRNGEVITEYQQHFFSPTFVEDKDFRSVSTTELDLVGEKPAVKKLTNLNTLVGA